MLGVSYGTHVIQRYARAHPDRLERAVLDSPIAPGGVNALQLDSFAAVPRVLADLQRGAVGQTARLVRRLATRPLTGRFDGADRRMTGSYELYGVLTAGDYSGFLRGQYPAAVRAANAGWSAPLLRLFTIANREQQYPLSEVSFGAYAAATCADTVLPWAQDSDPAIRPPLFDASVAAVSDASVAPFDRAAVRNLAVSGPCQGWPAIATGPDAAPAAYAPIPELTLVGLSDLRTPLESARAVQAAWPGSGLVTVKGAGHGTLTASPCVTGAVLRFLGGAAPANARCASDEGLDRALARFPTSLRQVTPVGGHGRAARAFAAAAGRSRART
jgi:pimeloyl-ACP methyl ester carboxylesterase